MLGLNRTDFFTNCFPIPDSDRANFGNLATADAIADGFQQFFILSADGQLTPYETGCHCRVVPDEFSHQLLKGLAVLFCERNDID
jgi:hypothetical protein